jgi:hypothetical protein
LRFRALGRGFWNDRFSTRRFRLAGRRGRDLRRDNDGARRRRTIGFHRRFHPL